MCRLFGMNAGARPVTATFWLLDAPDSLAPQSHRNPDGTGIGVFGPDRTPLVEKQPIAAWDDIAFAIEARELTGTTFVAHVRHASTGGHTLANTHPFEQRRRLFAHNGVVRGPGPAGRSAGRARCRRSGVGETDSERVFALDHRGDRRARRRRGRGCDRRDRLDHRASARLFRSTSSSTTATDLWALRYPAANELWLLPRRAGGTAGRGALDARTDRIHARSASLADAPAWSSPASRWTPTRIGARCPAAS